MSIRRRPRGRIIPALVGCFYAGIAVGWLLHVAFTPKLPSPEAIASAPAGTSGERGERAREGDDKVRLKADPTEADTTEAHPTRAEPGSDIATIGVDPIAQLRRKGLRLPIDNADVEAIEGGFAERRSGGRPHEAVDILAPRNTPVRAVDGGTIAKLFFSKAGGTTLYQFDPSEQYCYYYAHLEQYAPGIREGVHVSAGDVIGYVGTSGNAPASTPHLHFAIFRLTSQKRWWEGDALDPYLVYRK
jgi:murein DD-endopeptidase MepM/ murein hydrolase activator NlpD